MKTRGVAQFGLLGLALTLALQPALAGLEAEVAPAESSSESDGALTQAPAAGVGAGTVAGGRVSRASFTTAVVDREPVDSLETLPADRDQIFYFTELQGLEGQVATHRWEFNGEVIAEVPFEVRGPRWRVYSSKRLLPTWLGEWRVSVIDEAGQVLRADTFVYVASAAPPAGPSEATTGPADPSTPPASLATEEATDGARE